MCLALSSLCLSLHFFILDRISARALDRGSASAQASLYRLRDRQTGMGSSYTTTYNAQNCRHVMDCLLSSQVQQQQISLKRWGVEIIHDAQIHPCKNDIHRLHRLMQSEQLRARKGKLPIYNTVA
ncbi:hypothetical protein QR685DRAFT_542291 [Neurospora intermedia]|uniref:Secreted protein n=1 Tax=Neurospora intermedia TaxID=5142 RepID=A0ABR3DM63_NEUIN